MILHIKAITEKIAYEIPHISIKAKYVESKANAGIDY